MSYNEWKLVAQSSSSRFLKMHLVHPEDRRLSGHLSYLSAITQHFQYKPVVHLFDMVAYILLVKFLLLWLLNSLLKFSLLLNRQDEFLPLLEVKDFILILICVFNYSVSNEQFGDTVVAAMCIFQSIPNLVFLPGFLIHHVLHFHVSLLCPLLMPIYSVFLLDSW